MKLPIVFEPPAWEDYLYWNATNRKTFAKLNGLIKECQRNPTEGSGKPEQLKNKYAG